MHVFLKMNLHLTLLNMFIDVLNQQGYKYM